MKNLEVISKIGLTFFLNGGGGGEFFIGGLGRAFFGVGFLFLPVGWFVVTCTPFGLVGFERHLGGGWGSRDSLVEARVTETTWRSDA